MNVLIHDIHDRILHGQSSGLVEKNNGNLLFSDSRRFPCGYYELSIGRSTLRELVFAYFKLNENFAGTYFHA